MKRSIQQRFHRWLPGLWVFLLVGINPSGIVIEAKDLPVPATIRELASQPDQFDGIRVFVSGRVRSITIEVGRRGSQFASVVLEDAASGSGNVTVHVFSLIPPKFGEGAKISVQGVYHREGRFGGLPYDQFIEADVIIRDM